jgi:phage terminase large subunit-like protein
VDLAKHVDFTVIIVLDQNGHLCYFDRFSQIDWTFQEKRIVEVAKKYNNARILVDSSGVGDPIYENLRRAGVQVEGYKFTNASKKDLIENLSIAIENKTISYPDIPVLLSELGLFGYKISQAGITTYNAPDGYHDDSVIALALACWYQNKPKANPAFILY